MPTQPRDYYTNLFTPDSDSESSENTADPYSRSQSHHLADLILQGNSILQDESFFPRVFDFTFDTKTNSISGAPVSVDNTRPSLPTFGSASRIGDIQFTPDTHIPTPASSAFDHTEPSLHNTGSPSPIINLLDEDEIVKLLEIRSAPLTKVSPNSKISTISPDKIGCYNVQNKFDHDTAAEFFIKEDMSFLALQEPFASNYKHNDSWASFQQLEMQNARIQCFVTPFQIVMYDTWKWGGKILDAFSSHLYGRVTSIAFNLGDTQKIGIISVYASTTEALAESKNPNESSPPFLTSAEIVAKIVDKWKHDFPGICDIIIGDMQETWSTTDKDNMGTYRCNKPQNGILSLLKDTHCSLVREKHPDRNYITRIGQEGGRGIDHILFPKHAPFQKWIISADIDRFKGGMFFPSDHSYIFCTFSRHQSNNNDSSIPKTKFAYNKIFNIKIKRSGLDENILSFDDTQFKDCQKFRDQKTLYANIQRKTGDTSVLTNHFITDLEKRAMCLFRSLWFSGISQDVDGPENKLVRISDEQAIEVAHIVSKYNASTREIMKELDLTSVIATNNRASNIRNRLRRGKGFKPFSNLPVPTKTRYLRLRLQRKVRLIKQAITWLKEFKLLTQLQKIPPPWSEFVHILVKIHDTTTLSKHSKNLYDMAMLEAVERETHVQAILFEKSQCNCRVTKPSDTSPHENIAVPNKLQGVPDAMVENLNTILKNSNCPQYFGTTSGETSFNFLLDCISSWKDDVSKINMETENMNSVTFLTDALTNLDLALSKSQQKISQCGKLQSSYRRTTHLYLLDVNRIGDFAKKMLPKGRSLPTTHTEIWDNNLQQFRNCVNEEEELLATQEFHGNWMGNSRANIVCAFAEIRTEGRLGYRGVDLFPNKLITNNDISDLVFNGHKLPHDIKAAFVNAHGTHVSDLFKPPSEDLRELFYPFFLTNEFGRITEEKVLSRFFWKALSSIPSKARFDGFQLAVIGRFGRRWQILLFNIVKLLLIMRYVPSDLKRIARFPIPKPGKVNEYRPISLCHDLYCFLNGIITTFSSAGIELARILHVGLVAYRKGKGCHSLVTIEQCFREDCMEGGEPCVQLDEDEEKFFDRIPVAILLAAMRVNGFPEQGYIEFKASAMGAKEVEIVTCKGTAYAKFICGLEQGNPDSPTIANLVIKFKHDVWGAVSKEIETIFNRHKMAGNEKYIFNSKDDIDGTVSICKIGYCDDNSKYIRAENENDLPILVQYYLQLAGDISMVTKIGRKGAKCDIQFFNISANLTLKLTQCSSIAWSFKADAPVRENVPFRVNLQPEEYIKFKCLTDYDNLELEQQLIWDEIVKSKPHKHLGLIGTLSGDTSASSLYFISKMKERLTKLKVYNLHIQPQIKCINMLVNTMHSYIPLQANHNRTDLINFDNLVVNFIKKSHGITSTDIKHNIYLPVHHGGIGLTSAMEIDLISIARELEILSNSSDLDSYTFRTRIAAIKKIQYNSQNNFFNHAKDAIQKLASYGIHFRDSADGIINDILAYFCKMPQYCSIGHSSYSDGNGHNLGLGKACNFDLAYGGVVHEMLLKIRANKWQFNSKLENLDKQCPIKLNKISEILPRVKTKKFKESVSLFKCWEWTTEITSHQPVDTSPMATPSIRDGWRLIDIPTNTANDVPNIDWNNRDMDLWECIRKHLLIIKKRDFIFRTASPASVGIQNYNKHSHIFNFIFRSKSPIIIATDGSLREIENEHQKMKHANSAFTMGILHIKDGESIASGEWTDRPFIPLLCRINALPTQIGDSDVDISIAECDAFLMEELCLPSYLPRVMITDSETVRDQILYARNEFDGNVNRKFIRSNIGGISKCIMGNLANLLCLNTNILETSVQPHNASPIQQIIQTLHERNKEFLSIAKTWTTSHSINKPTSNSNADHQHVFSNKKINTSQIQNSWRDDYFDENTFKPILKVNSHQLDDSGRYINDKPRYARLIPNYCLLHANHVADTIAEFPFQLSKASFPSTRKRVDCPISPLRFSLAMNGKTLDKHVSASIQHAITHERLKRIRTKATQGLLWRIIKDVSDNWASLQSHKGLLRSLYGLSRTHTRSLYKSSIYRDGCHLEYLESISAPPPVEPPQSYITNTQKISLLKKCVWCTSKHSDQGNRMHAFLNCTHPDLTYFRSNVNDIIIKEMQGFLQMLQHYNSSLATICLLDRIQDEFLFYQSSQKGRLRKIPESINSSYIPIRALMNKYNATCILACSFESSSNVCLLEILGLQPNNMHIYINDANIGVLDAPWLGLMPKKVNTVIIEHIQSIGLNKTTHSNQHQIKQTLEDKWDLIKGLIMGKAIGLHRITGMISSAKEKHLRKKYDLDKGSLRALKKQTKLPLNNTFGKKTTNNKNCITIPSKKPGIYTNLCKGISCDNTKLKWDILKDFRPNRIKSTIKHCTRCAKYCTILNIGRDILYEMLKNPTIINKNFISVLSNFCVTKPSYIPLMNLLNAFIPQPSKKHKATPKNRGKTSDQHKNLCKVLSQIFTNLPQHEIELDHNAIISSMHTQILHRISFNSSYLSEVKQKSKIRHKTIETIIQSSVPENSLINETHINIETPKNYHTSRKIIKEIVIDEDNAPSSQTPSTDNYELQQRRTYLDEALNDSNGLLSSMAIMRAIEVFRHESVNNHFFATAEASSILTSWNVTEGWERAARIFGSRIVLNSKPDGFYFIPLFGGNHWTLAVVQKIGCYRKGIMLDSLGLSHTTYAIHDAIKNMFILEGGGRFDWQCSNCFSQTEMECGLRVIIAIKRIISALQEHQNIDRAIRAATLQDEFGENRRYDSMLIRREAAEVIGSFRSNMWTGPVGIRNNQGTPGNDSANGKRKRRRRKK